MQKNNYILFLKQHERAFLVLFMMFFFAQVAMSQAHIRLKVVSVQTHNNVDCDGVLVGNSDFVWEFIATDNTLGKTNNSPSATSILGDFNHAYVNGNNGPYVHRVSAPLNDGGFNPSNGVFFYHDYVCPSDIPSQLNLKWEAYENDGPLNYDITGLQRDGETGSINQVIPVPATPGLVNSYSFSATSIDGGCRQNYTITLEIERINIITPTIADNICDAQQLTVNGAAQKFIWCADATLESGEPNQGDISNNKSRWFYFVAPASGRVEISTAHNDTDFGTYFEIYHAADGAGCTAGLSPFGTLIKNKFEYLSYIDYADMGGTLNLSGKADITFNDCNSLTSSNPLVAGETYYIQLTTDDADQRGYIAISVRNVSTNGSPAEAWDIPCGGINTSNHALSTTPRRFDLGSGHSADLSFSCATDRETGAHYVGSDPERFRAYDYNHAATNNGTIHESTWAQFTAPNSGRIYFEGDVRGFANLNETENTALFAYDSRFAPGRPSDYSCANLTNIAAAEGGTGLIGANPTAIIRQQCLEPGFTYYAMIDPAGAATADKAHVWFYDPSAEDPANNPPANDILCLALTDTLFRVPVIPADSVLPFAAVAGSNVRACIEKLAGEPVSNTSAALRADQTVWHYFTAPASGVAEIRLRAYIGMNRLNYAIYPLLNGTDCYGGLKPAAYTQNGLPTGDLLDPIAQGSTDFGGTTISLCCLQAGATYAIQLDGGSPNDVGQYIIEFIREMKVYAGDSRYVTTQNDTINYNSNDTAFICFGDAIYPSVMLNGLGQSTTVIPQCLEVGYVLHSMMPTPNPVANTGFTFVHSSRGTSPVFLHNGDGSGSFGNPRYNEVYYVSALADEAATWGALTCSSASIENGAPVVFLRPLAVNHNYDASICAINFTITGGLPQFDATNHYYTYTIVNAAGDTVLQDTAAYNLAQIYNVSVAANYTIYVKDNANCEYTFTVNAMPCLDPCINNPVVINPQPINNSVYDCLSGGIANVTLNLTGGAPTVNGSPYTVIVSGSSVANANGTFTHTTAQFTFTVSDNDAWQVIVADENDCRDTVAHVFTYNSTTCANFCALNPTIITPTYNCLPNQTALVEVTVSGGLPSVLGGYYLASVNGSSVFGQSFNNAQLPAVVGSSATFSFVVNDGDAWQLIIADTVPCADTTSGIYEFNTTNCPDACDILNLQVFSPRVLCNNDGTGLISVSISGGTPDLLGGDYIVTVNGSTNGSVIAQAVQGYVDSTIVYEFDVTDGDTWTIIVQDAQGCSDTLTGTFIFNSTTCGTSCMSDPITLNVADYACNFDSTATVSITLAGGRPAYDGSNYTVIVSGSTTGSNTIGTAVAGAVNGTVIYTFTVRHGDHWQVFVSDVEGCQAATQGAFVWNATNCANICTNPAYTAISVNNGAGFTYDCHGNNGLVTLSLNGGLPTLDGGNSSYFVAVNINNISTVYPVNVIGGIATLTIEIPNGATWFAQVWDAIGCDTMQTANLIFNTVRAIARTDASNEILIGEYATLDGSASQGNNLTYVWTPTTRVENPTQAITRVQPVETMYYTLQVTDNMGCSHSDSVKVAVGACVPMHSGFTPNGDGTNDTWQIPCLTLFDNEVQVFNRWGQEVFSAVNYDGTWDGTNDGKDLAAGVYYYVIKVSYPNLPESVLFKGTVTIIR